MTIGPFKTDENGNQVAISTSDRKKNKLRVSRKEVLSILETIKAHDSACKITIVGSKRFCQNELVTYTITSRGILFKGEGADSCSCYFDPADRDAIIHFDKNTISMADNSGAAITIHPLSKHYLPVELSSIIPNNINNCFTRGECNLFTGELATIRMNLEDQYRKGITTAIAKEVNHIAWIVFSSVTETGHLCKYPFTVESFELTPTFDEETNTCSVEGDVIIYPPCIAVTPQLYIEEITGLLENRVGQIKNTPGTIDIHQAADVELQNRLRLHVKVTKGIRVVDTNVIKQNSKYVSEKLSEVLKPLCTEDAPGFPSHMAHYTVPVKCSDGNSLYVVLVGLGAAKLAAVADILNTNRDLLEEPHKSTTLTGTESWMMRIYFKGQQK